MDPLAPPPGRSPGCPFRPEPKQPRLSILHLLVGTACVAVYLSVRTSVFAPDVRPDRFAAVVICLDGLGGGTALGGVLLFVARRWRGLAFPSQPGETLFVLLGIGAAAGLIMWVLNCLVPGHQRVRADYASLFLGQQVFSPIASLILSGTCLIVAGYTPIPRWRLFFATAAAAHFLDCCIPGPRLLASAVLVWVAIQDLRQGIRYRWTHWAGVWLGLWFGAMSLVWLVWCAYYVRHFAL